MNLQIGCLYIWNHDESKQNIMKYIGKEGSWNQFELALTLGEVWCEILDRDLDMIRLLLEFPV
jgi:hypothetical protein